MLSFVTPAFAQAEDSQMGGATEHGLMEPQATTEAEGSEHGGGFPPFEPSTYGSQLLWLAITFGLLYWLMSKLIVPRIGGIIEDRDRTVSADLAAAETLKSETDAAITAYEQALAEARSRAHGIAQEARNRSKADLDANRASIEADLDRRVGEAETRIADVKTRALADVDAIARDAAEALVETLLGTGVPQPEVAAAVSAAMSERR